MSLLEETLEKWAAPLTKGQEEKCARAVKEVKAAIAEDAKLGAMLQSGLVEVFAQGSYENNVNVRDESDVDVCVLCKQTYRWQPTAMTLEETGGVPATYEFSDYKQDVFKALRDYFGNAATWGNKAFDIKADKNGGVEADAAPCFVYRRYSDDKSGPPVLGTTLRPDDSQTWISNHPRQQREAGDTKNKLTNWRYKKAVRIIKKTNYEMIAQGEWPEDRTASFLLESAVSNLPNDVFAGSLFVPMIQRVLRSLYHVDDEALAWLESNEVKYLFLEGQNWSLGDVRDFAGVAWDFLGLDQ